MNYNERYPNFSFRVPRNMDVRLNKLAKLEKLSKNEFARKILTMFLENKLIEKTEDLQTEKIKLQIEKLKLENKYLQIKCDFADNFHAPISQSASHFLKPKPMIINETQSQEFQSPYDASNHRLKCPDCGKTFEWSSYAEFNTQCQKFQRHLSEDHMRKMNETEKYVMTGIIYEGDSTTI